MNHFRNIKEDVKMVIVGQCVMELEDGATLQIGQEQVQILLALETMLQNVQSFIKLATKIIALAHAGISEINDQKLHYFCFVNFISSLLNLDFNLCCGKIMMSTTQPKQCLQNKYYQS